MRKLFILIVLSLFSTTAFALVETASNGPQNVTACWIKGAPTIAKGSLVCLVTGSSVTFPGKEVTGTDTDLGLTSIYGVYVGDTITSSTTEMTRGTWIKVQTHGYVNEVAIDGIATQALACRAGNVIFPSTTTYEGTLLGATAAGGTAFADSTTGNVMAFAEPVAGCGTVSAWINGI